MQNYSFIQKLLHDLVLSHKFINKSLFEIEKLIYLKKKDIINNSHIFITGLPRSGTSMMMQILEAGGMDILADHVREPDTDNIKGYYEYEKVKSLHKDNTWLKSCEGKTVKIVSNFLNYLRRYKINAFIGYVPLHKSRIGKKFLLKVIVPPNKYNFNS